MQSSQFLLGLAARVLSVDSVSVSRASSCLVRSRQSRKEDVDCLLLSHIEIREESWCEGWESDGPA